MAENDAQVLGGLPAVVLEEVFRAFGKDPASFVVVQIVSLRIVCPRHAVRGMILQRQFIYHQTTSSSFTVSLTNQRKPIFRQTRSPFPSPMAWILAVPRPLVTGIFVRGRYPPSEER